MGALLGHSVCVTTIACIGAVIISGDERGVLKVWLNFKCVQTMQLFHQIITIVASDNVVLVQLRDGTIASFIYINGLLERQHDWPILCSELGFFKLVVNEAYLLASATPEAVQLYANSMPMRRFDFGNVICHCAAFVGDDMVVFGLDSGYVKGFSLSNDGLLFDVKVLDEAIFSISVCGDKIAVAGAAKRVGIGRVVDKCIVGLVHCELLGVGVSDILLSEDIVYVGCWDGKVRIFSYDSIQRGVLDKHRACINCLALIERTQSPTRPNLIVNTILVSASKDGSIFAWDLDAGNNKFVDK